MIDIINLLLQALGVAMTAVTVIIALRRR